MIPTCILNFILIILSRFEDKTKKALQVDSKNCYAFMSTINLNKSMIVFCVDHRKINFINHCHVNAVSEWFLFEFFLKAQLIIIALCNNYKSLIMPENDKQ